MLLVGLLFSHIFQAKVADEEPLLVPVFFRKRRKIPSLHLEIPEGDGLHVTHLRHFLVLLFELRYHWVCVVHLLVLRVKSLHLALLSACHPFYLRR